MRNAKLGQIGILLAGGVVTAAMLIAVFVFFTFAAPYCQTLLPITVESAHFRIHSADAEKAQIASVLAERALERICSKILRYSPKVAGRTDIFLWENDAAFRNAVRGAEISNAGVSRVYTSADGTTIRRIDISAVATLGAVLPHEITHLLLAEIDIARNRKGLPSVPLAFHEGVSTLAEGKCNDELLMRSGAGVDCMAQDACSHKGRHAVNFEKLLSETSYKNIADPRGFYAESYSLAEYLMSKLGPVGMGRLLGHLENGLPLEDAMRNSMGLPAENFRHTFISGWLARKRSNTVALIAMR